MTQPNLPVNPVTFPVQHVNNPHKLFVKHVLQTEFSQIKDVNVSLVIMVFITLHYVPFVITPVNHVIVTVEQIVLLVIKLNIDKIIKIIYVYVLMDFLKMENYNNVWHVNLDAKLVLTLLNVILV